MAFRYAMSDVHGCIERFEEMVSLVDLSGDNELVLLGDYLDRMHERPELLTYFMDFQKTHPGRVVCLMGNHEEEYLRSLTEAGASVAAGGRGVSYGGRPLHNAPLQDAETLSWLAGLPLYYETEGQVFVHAGVDEEAGDLWRYACENWFFCSKHPWSEGPFSKDVIAGHVGTASIRESHGLEPSNGVYWDGESHYYIDGSTEFSGVLPLIKYDTETKAYSEFRLIRGVWKECGLTDELADTGLRAPRRAHRGRGGREEMW